ncbi:hypothetical protein Htur_1445 [Haloterrigena turkmenica DSM 5511]|uniref:DUF3784 domain-containing protein n=1 Tax=Haloterrigena turkmenica (strain ATCC 51198 / DSM 5511 / JCM 9101 / NCIMB 13204 / VKM B-1734 / 4k) TaxID=543526 RepID=D2RQ74_HALTV|nr:hypothetical protein [Haloterrigena turkmenica]ADB60333.1 hypothetical protein Htur_1445 [Haloterrigena turkmenica DSM 5511]
MVEPNHVSGVVWLCCGVAILFLGYLIAVRGRADLHADYDESVEPAYVSRWAGGTALLMGTLVVAYAIRELLYGFEPVALSALIVALLALSYLTKLFARGFGARSRD